MSLTNDAVAAFKSTFLSVMHRHEVKIVDTPPSEQLSPSTAPSLLEQSLLAVGRDSADIRRNHDAILTKASLLMTLQDDLLAVFDQAHQALEQLAEARSQLAKAEAVAKFEHDERETVAQRLATMTSSYHQSVSELEKLRPEARRLESALTQANERLVRSEADGAALSEELRVARMEAERKAADAAHAHREREAATAELAAANAFVAQKIADIAHLNERCEIAEQAARTSARALEESRGQSAAALVRLDEERVNLASAQSRIAAQETQLKDLGEKFSAARAAWSQEAERFNQTIGRLQDELAQACGRNDAHQRLLASAQSDVAQLRRQNTDLENQLSESRHGAKQTMARAEVAEAARDQFSDDLATSKRLHQSLLRRVKPMIAALREKNAEGVKLSATLADFERRFQAFQAEAGETIRRLEEKETQLVAELETERARRVVAEGALAIDRSFRPIETQRRRPAGELEAPSVQLLGSRE